MQGAPYPSLYQINTRTWLTQLSQGLGRPPTLDDIPDAELDRLAEKGFDWVWFLSVWQTGLAAQRVSRQNPEWRKEFKDTLPDLTEQDIPGSGFAITGYTVHQALGGNAALTRLRASQEARPAFDARLCAQPHRSGPPLGGGPSRVLRSGHGVGFGSGAPELCVGQAQARRFDTGVRPRSLFCGLAGYPSTQLRQPGHTGSHDRRTSEDRRAM